MLTKLLGFVVIGTFFVILIHTFRLSLSVDQNAVVVFPRFDVLSLSHENLSSQEYLKYRLGVYQQKSSVPRGSPQAGVRVVVTRFDEDLQWLSTLPAEVHIAVMNKGEPLSAEVLASHPRIEVFARPNLGRECDGILSYIHDNYDNHYDVTVFLHGDPFGHASDNLQQKISSIYGQLMEGAKIPTYQSLNEGPIVFRCADQQLDECCALDRNDMSLLWNIFWPRNGEGAGLSDAPPMCVGMMCCAQFAVPRASIVRHPKSTWYSAQMWLFNNYGDSAHEACAALEHYWHIIFGAEPIIWGVPEEMVRTHYHQLKPLLDEYPNMKCQIDEWKQGTVSAIDGRVPCTQKARSILTHLDPSDKNY